MTYAIGKGQRLVMLECPECYWSVPINPNHLPSHEAQKDEPSENPVAEPVKYPEYADGIMSYVNDGQRYRQSITGLFRMGSFANLMTSIPGNPKSSTTFPNMR